MKKLFIIFTCFILAFSSIPFVSGLAETTVIYGDIDRDLQVSVNDLLLVRQRSLKFCEFNDSQIKSADVNRDTSVDMNYYLMLKRHLANISLLPNGKIYFVAKSGNDSNNGSEESPFLTIQKAKLFLSFCHQRSSG